MLEKNTNILTIWPCVRKQILTQTFHCWTVRNAKDDSWVERWSEAKIKVRYSNGWHLETPRRDQKERNRLSVTNVKAWQVMQVCTLVSFAGRMSAVARGAPLACAQGSLCQIAAIAVRQSQSPAPLSVCIWNVLRKKAKTIGISLQWQSAPIALTKRLCDCICCVYTCIEFQFETDYRFLPSFIMSKQTHKFDGTPFARPLYLFASKQRTRQDCPLCQTPMYNWKQLRKHIIDSHNEYEPREV